MKQGFLNVAKFSEKIGCSTALVYNWIHLGQIPFETDGKTKIIPEHAGMDSEPVRRFIKRKSLNKDYVVPIPTPTEMKPFTPGPIEQVIQKALDGDIPEDEKLFLIGRQKAAGYITRARFCRQQKRTQAEAELLWMAVEQFGFKL